MTKILLDVSVAAIITAILKIMVPGDKYRDQIKLLISCFFIVTTINSLTNNINIVEINNIFETKSSYNDYSKILEEQTADETANVLRKKLITELEKENIKPEKIYIDVNISEKYGISISKIKLVFEDTNTFAAERAVDITEKYTGNEIIVELEEQ